MAKVKTTPRAHGLQRPWRKNQISTWIVVPSMATGYFLTTATFLQDDERIIFVSAYAALTFLLLVNWLLCTFLDPAKPALIQCCTMGEQQRELRMYCHISKKNVPGFDHFCTWLNVAIGSRQYPFFCVLVLSGFLMNALHFAVSLLLLLRDDDFPEARAEEVFGNENVLTGLLGLQAFLSFGAGFCFSVLGSFHLSLQCKGYGTYLFLVEKRKRERVSRAERASKMNLDREPLGDKLRRICGCEEKEDTGSRLTIEVTSSRPGSNMSRDQNVMSLDGVHDSFEGELKKPGMKEISPASAKAGANDDDPSPSTTFETSVATTTIVEKASGAPLKGN